MKQPYAKYALLVAVLLTVPALAYRREYKITLDGQRKPGSEVCFRRGERPDVFSLFFTPGPITCLPADDVLDLPPGLFYVFARHPDGFVSTQRDYFSYGGPAAPERGFEQLETPLSRAGTVDFAVPAKSLAANQALGVWVAPTPENTTGTFIPLVIGETTLLAPATTPIIPILTEGDVPVALGEPLYLEAGERITMPAFNREQANAVLTVKLDTVLAHQAQTVLPAPEIVLQSHGKTFRPIVPPLEPASHGLLIFKDVPPGEALITVGGSMWQPIKRRIELRSGVTVVDREALPLLAAGSVAVHWSTNSGTPEATACADARTEDVPVAGIAIQRCVTSLNQRPQCSNVAGVSVPYSSSATVTLDGLASGDYVVSFTPPYGKEQRVPVAVITGRRTQAEVTIAPFSFFGTVKVNGKPVRARVIFASGQAVSDDTGRYTALLAAPPATNQIHVELCGSLRSFAHIPTESIVPNSPYDIDIRTSQVDVSVLDPDGAPVRDAAVTFAPVKEKTSGGENVAYYTSASVSSDDKGKAVLQDVPSSRPLVVCASHDRFTTKCSDVIEVRRLADGAQAKVQFDRVGLRGKVEGHSGLGIVAFVDPTGRTTEQITLAADGRFIARNPHAAPEHFVYASDTRPLSVIAMPLVQGGEWNVSVHPAPVRSFAVSVTDMPSRFGFVGVWVGGKYVPLQLLNFHEEQRGLDCIAHRDRPVQIKDVSETGPISVAFGSPDPSAKDFVDVFALPQYAGVKRHAVTGTEVAIPAQ